MSYYPKIAQPVGGPVPRAPAPVSTAPGNTNEFRIRVSIRPEYRIDPPVQMPPSSFDIPHADFKFEFDTERAILMRLRSGAAGSGGGLVGGSSSFEAGLSDLAPQGASQTRSAAVVDGPGALPAAAMVLSEHASGPAAAAGGSHRMHHDAAPSTFGAAGGPRGSDRLRTAGGPLAGQLQQQQQEQQEQQQGRAPAASTWFADEARAMDELCAKYAQGMGLDREAVRLAVGSYGDDQKKVVDFCSSFSIIREMGFGPSAITTALISAENDTGKALSLLAP